MIPLKDDIPTEKRPIITVVLIALNTAIFLYQFSLGQASQRLVFQMGLIPYEVTHQSELYTELSFPIPLTFLTAMFLHGGWLHLLGNMLYLWIFGNNIEDKLGHMKFIIFYLLAGVLASLTYIFTNPNSKIPMIGASGAIAGVLGAYLLKFPKARILTLIFFGYFARIVHIPAIFVLGFWFILQILYGLPALSMQHAGGGVAGLHILEDF